MRSMARALPGPHGVGHKESYLGPRNQILKALGGSPNVSADFWPEAIHPPGFPPRWTPHDALRLLNRSLIHHGCKADTLTPWMKIHGYHMGRLWVGLHLDSIHSKTTMSQATGFRAWTSSGVPTWKWVKSTNHDI
jgi:hypothetical protein